MLYYVLSMTRGTSEEEPLNSDFFETWYADVSWPPESIATIFIWGRSLLSDPIGSWSYMVYTSLTSRYVSRHGVHMFVTVYTVWVFNPTFLAPT